MFLIWIALHFPVNTRGVYAAALLIPYIFGYRSIAIAARNFRNPERKEAAALAVLLFVLVAHLLAALKPEISADGLSMHLALPLAVAREARWAFDFRLNSWALMPTGADSLYAAAYLLGGENAAHLLNFAFLALTCMLVARAARRWISPAQSLADRRAVRLDAAGAAGDRIAVRRKRVGRHDPGRHAGAGALPGIGEILRLDPHGDLRGRSHGR